MTVTIRRILAYFFDIMVVALVSSMISMTTINPFYENKMTLQEEFETMQETYTEKLSQIDESNDEEVQRLLEEKVNFYKEFVWKSNRNALFDNSLTIILVVVYFVVFAYFFEGETVGKRVMKIRVVDKNEKRVSFGKLLLRALILHGLPLIIVNMILVYILSKESYFVVSSIIYFITFILEISIIISTFVRKDKRGIHDLLVGTKVIEVRSE